MAREACLRCWKYGHVESFCLSRVHASGYFLPADIPIGKYAVIFRMQNGLKTEPRIHAQPLATSTIIGSLSKVTQIDAYGVRGEWVKVIHGGVRGYVRVSKKLSERETETYLRKITN